MDALTLMNAVIDHRVICLPPVPTPTVLTNAPASKDLVAMALPVKISWNAQTANSTTVTLMLHALSCPATFPANAILVSGLDLTAK